MADRIVNEGEGELPEIPEVLAQVQIAALAEARATLEAGEEVVPFTALAKKDTLFLEQHPVDSAEECYRAARHTVQNVTGADAYALCYDGYVDSDDGQLDALIAEGGVPGDENGYAVGYLYEWGEGEDDLPHVTSDIIYIGPAPNFMALTGVGKAGADEAEDAYDDEDFELFEDQDALEDYDRISEEDEARE